MISLASVIALLFYRHEYHRLRYVLEVLNFFGTPAESNYCPVVNETTLWQKIDSIASPGPLWQHLDDGHYVSSAFWEQKKVFALALGPSKNGFTGKHPFGCEIWFANSIDPIQGKVHVTPFEKKKVRQGFYQSYRITCEMEEALPSVPDEVTFWKMYSSQPRKFAVPVHNKDNNIFPDSGLALAVCVLPDNTKRTSAADIGAFISYHTLIGVTDFVVYDGERYSSTLSKYQRRGVSVVGLPWNYPNYSFNGTERGDVERDCRSRVRSVSARFIVLSFNEFIVPKSGLRLMSSLQDVNIGKRVNFQLSTVLFCNNLPDDPGAEPSWPMFMNKTKFDPVVKTDSVKVALTDAEASTRSDLIQVSSHIAAVHRYAHCNIPSEAALDLFKYDPVIRRFASDLIKSGLLNIHLSVH